MKACRPPVRINTRPYSMSPSCPRPHPNTICIQTRAGPHTHAPWSFVYFLFVSFWVSIIGNDTLTSYSESWISLRHSPCLELFTRTFLIQWDTHVKERERCAMLVIEGRVPPMLMLLNPPISFFMRVLFVSTGTSLPIASSVLGNCLPVDGRGCRSCFLTSLRALEL